jgi:hypothetical protein
MGYRFKTDGMGFAAFEERRNLSFSKEKPKFAKQGFIPARD